MQQAKFDRVLPLAAAAIVVGLAIGIDGDARRILNDIGGIVWIVVSALITIPAIGVGTERKQSFLVLSTILVLAAVIRPTDLGWALIGFGWGGVLVGFVGRERDSLLGALLAAWWLPAHLVIAMTRSVIRELGDQPTSLRSDPPPAAVLVPMAMRLAAWTFAVLTANWRGAREDGALLVPLTPVGIKQDLVEYSRGRQ